MFLKTVLILFQMESINFLRFLTRIPYILQLYINAICTARLEREKLEKEERAKKLKHELEQEKLEKEGRAEKLRIEHELELEKLKIQKSANHSNGAKEQKNETSIDKMIKRVKPL